MKLIHMSDIHLTAPGTTVGGRDPRKNFERALAHVLRDHRDAELMVITGDLSDCGDRNDYRWLKARLDAFPIPVRLCIGNHDDRAAFLDVFPGLAAENGFVQGVHDTSAARCLFLDTTFPKTHAGRYCDDRLGWLAARLEEHDGGFLLFMHHNPMPTHLPPFDEIGLLDGAEFRQLVARYSTTHPAHLLWPLPPAARGIGCRRAHFLAARDQSRKLSVILRDEALGCGGLAGILWRRVPRQQLRHRSHGGVRLRRPDPL